MSIVNNSSVNFVEQVWPGVDSKFRLVILAALRNKQLMRGARSRLVADEVKHRNTRIAVEEIKQGLVAFTVFTEDLGAKIITRPVS